MPHKDTLLAISEKVVDFSEELDALDFSDDNARKHEIRQELRKIADQTLEIRSDVKGDDYAYASFILGSICSILGFWLKAEEAYDEALEIWPDHVGLLNEAFEVQVELDNYSKAKKFIKASIKHGGETPDVLFNLASLQAHYGFKNEARITLINALAKFPNDDGCKELLKQLDSTTT